MPDEAKRELRAAHATLNAKRMKREIDRLTERVFAVQRQLGTPRKASKTV